MICIADLFVNTWQRQSNKDRALLSKKWWWRDSSEVNVLSRVAV